MPSRDEPLREGDRGPCVGDAVAVTVNPDGNPFGRHPGAFVLERARFVLIERSALLLPEYSPRRVPTSPTQEQGRTARAP